MKRLSNFEFYSTKIHSKILFNLWTVVESIDILNHIYNSFESTRPSLFALKSPFYIEKSTDKYMLSVEHSIRTFDLLFNTSIWTKFDLATKLLFLLPSI
jgi:hypothetical protein